MAISEQEGVFIRRAFQFLDQPSFLMRAANALGKPVDMALGALPARAHSIIRSASQKALNKGLVAVLKTLPTTPTVAAPSSLEELNARTRRTGRWHSAASFGMGAAGGFFGIASLPIELPVTTAIILRSIAAIAADFGMDLSDPQVRLECLYILSLGSAPRPGKDAMASAYWASRTAFARMSGEAAAFLAGKSINDLARDMEKHAAPVLVKLLTTIAARFEVVVSEKILAVALPVLGAVGGGVINAAFADYFADAARFHFGLRALEARHGRKAVEECYATQARISKDA